MALISEPTVFLVDDDHELRESIQWMLQVEGIPVESYSTPRDFLASYDAQRPGCLVLDLKLPGMSGVELCQELQRKGGQHPFIVITGHGDVSNAVEAMRTGAVDFIQKPFGRQAFLDAVRNAFDRDAGFRARQEKHREIHQRMQSLTPREREVLELVVDGELTKNIARKLGISPKTVEVHRSHINTKLGADSTPQLVRMVIESATLNKEK